MTYGITFKTFGKIDVNGENADPLYVYLKKEAPFAIEDEAAKGLYNLLSEKGFNTSGDDIKWNFTKFLVSRDGKVIARFAPTLEPKKIGDQIEELLNEK